MRWVDWGSALGAFMLAVGLLGLLVLQLGCPAPCESKAPPPPREVEVVRLRPSAVRETGGSSGTWLEVLDSQQDAGRSGGSRRGADW